VQCVNADVCVCVFLHLGLIKLWAVILSAISFDIVLTHVPKSPSCFL